MYVGATKLRRAACDVQAVWILRCICLAAVQARGGAAAVFSNGRRPSGVVKSVLDTTRTDGGRRDEIFVDIVERLTATFNSSGYLQSSQIDGAIVVGFSHANAGTQHG